MNCHAFFKGCIADLNKRFGHFVHLILLSLNISFLVMMFIKVKLVIV